MQLDLIRIVPFTEFRIPSPAERGRWEESSAMTATSRLRACPLYFCLIACALVAQAAFAEDAPAAPAAAATAPPAAAATDAAPADAAAADPDLAAAVALGQQEYLKQCRACHGTKGTAGVPLATNEKVAAGPDYLIWAILTGPGYMPEFGPVLSNEEIASIATFIENSWGNSYGIVTPDDVQAAR